MKIKLSILSTGVNDADTAYNVLSKHLGDCTINSVLYDNLILEVDADGARIDDIPAQILDAIEETNTELEEDFGIPIEIEKVSAC